MCRNEDVPLLTGIARYLPDLRFGQLHAAFVRSTVASARITDVRTGAALAAPGVVTVATARRPFPGSHPRPPERRPVCRCSIGLRWPTGSSGWSAKPSPWWSPRRPARRSTRPGWSRSATRPCPSWSTPKPRWLDGCFVLFPEHGSNRAHQVSVGGEGDVLAGAEIVVRGRFVNQRVSAAPMETNGALALPGDHGRAVTVWASTQRVHQLRDELALVLDLDASDVRVVTPQVGGGFGAKYDAAPEAAVVAAHGPSSAASRHVARDPHGEHGLAVPRPRPGAVRRARAAPGRNVRRAFGSGWSAMPGPIP